MNTPLPPVKSLAASVCGRFFLALSIILCFSNVLLASNNKTRPEHKPAEKTHALNKAGSFSAGPPTVSYSGSPVFTAGTAITPVSPFGIGVAAPGYSTSTTTLGSGFNIPAGVAVDAAGNIYIGDQNNNVVKKIPVGSNTPVVIATGFSTPDGVAVDAQGNIYVADDGNNLVKEVPADGSATITLGSGFLQPFDVAVDNQGYVYVADRGNNAIKKISPGGGTTVSIGSGFATPTGVTVDNFGNVYVADNGNSAVKEILTNGTVVTLGSGFSNPFTVAVDGTGNVFVADYGHKLVKEIPKNGGPITTVGSGYSFIFGVTTDINNNVYVTDYGNNAVKKIQPTGGYYISPALPAGLSFDNATGTISGTPVAASPATNYTVTAYNVYGGNSTTVNITVRAVPFSYASPRRYAVGSAITPLAPTGGGAVAAPGYSTNTTTLGYGFNIPAGVAVDAAGNIYIGDQNNNAVKKIAAGTNITTTIATGFSTPDGIAIDAKGNIFVADDGNNLVKEIPANGGSIITLGSGFLQPFDVAVDSLGYVYVADRGNNAVEKISPDGTTTVAIGSGFSTPTGVAVDRFGNVYVADNGNSAVKEILTNGTVVTLGSGFSSPFTVAVDGTGNVFVADYGNKLVKEIPKNGGPIITLGSGYSFIFGVTTDIYNNVYVTDYGHNAVKEIQPTGGYYITPALPAGLNFDNTTGTISGTPTAPTPATNYLVTAYNQYGGNSVTVNIATDAVPINYSSPKVYTAGTTITPLTPTGSGAAAPGYSTSTTTLGSGFNIPAGVAVDAAGNIYIGDQNNNVVKEIPVGSNTPVTIATGFSTPDGVAVDTQGNVYVADDGNNVVKEIPVGGGAVITLATGFSQPFDVAVDNLGNVYVADRGNNAIKKIPPGGGTPVAIGSGFATPTGVAVDSFGNVYVADNGNSAVKEILTNGTVVTLGSGFSNPFKVTVDGTGNVFVTDFGNKQVKEIPINGGPIITVGSGYSFIYGVATDIYNNVYVTDYGHNALKKVQPTGGFYINPALPPGLSFNNTTGTISGTPTTVSPATNYTITAYNQLGGTSIIVNITVNAVPFSYTGPQTYQVGSAITPLTPAGTPAAAPGYSANTTTLGYGFNIPAGVAVDATGNVFIGDQNNNAVKKILAGTNTTTTIATGFSTPDGIAIDAQGNIYVADDGNNLVKEVPANGGAVITLATGFSQPFDVAVDNQGYVYVADRGNNAIKKIPPGGGTPVTVGSGFTTPTGVAVDSFGNVYVADNGNSAIKEVFTNGTISILGSGFSNPFTVSVDGTGNVFVADYGNKQVKEIPKNGGPILTVGSGYSFIFGVTTDIYNNVYMTDYGHNAVKKIQPTGGYYINPALPAGLSFNNTTGAISGTPTATSPATNYTISAYNQYGGNSITLNIKVLVNSSLSNLAVSNGTLSPAFSASTTTYTESVPYATSSITLTPTAIDPQATITVNGVGVTSGAASGAIALNPGPNTITTVVTAKDNSSITTYTLNVTRIVSTNAKLYALHPSTGQLTPGFTGANTSYTSSVANTVTSITVTPTAADNTATITVNGTAVTSGTASQSIPLTVGQNTITTVVTAQDGTTTKTYTLVVTRIGSSNANLYGMHPSVGVLTPGFTGANTSYTVSLANTVTSITITPTVTDNTATVTVNGAPVTSGTASQAIALTVGQNVINTVVTAQDGTTTKTYTLTATRAPSTNDNLTSMHPSNGTLSPSFTGANTSYTTSVTNTISSITITPVTAVNTATITVNGTAVVSGTASQSIPIAIGQNTINTVVTAQDGTTKKTYTLTVTRVGSNNDYLSGLHLSNGTLNPSFLQTTTSYTETVTNAVATITVTPKAADNTATIKVNGTTVASGATSGPIPLSEGASNAINIVVTAQDGTTIKTYTVTVTRAPSANDNLTSLIMSSGTLSPTFNANVTSYTVNVDNSVSGITVTATTADANAQLTIGTMVKSGQPSQTIPLNVGANFISVVVLAQDGVTTKTYTLNVNRAPSSNALLTSLHPSNGTLSPSFSPTTTSYTASVTNAVSSITITPKTADNTATIKVNGTTVASGSASPSIPIAVGQNTITAVATAQDGTTTKTYTLVVTRAAPSMDETLALDKPQGTATTINEVTVHPAVSPNGDGLNDVLTIDNIQNYPDNKLSIINSNGELIYQVKGYDNSSKVFDGHSNKTGRLQQPGTYFYSLDYTVNGASKHTTGYIVLKY